MKKIYKIAAIACIAAAIVVDLINPSQNELVKSACMGGFLLLALLSEPKPVANLQP